MNDGIIAQWLTKVFGKSWLTSVLGIFGGMAIVVQPIILSGRLPTRSEWTMAIISAVLGIASKSYNKSGV